jgi:hypothetical protein
LLHRTPHQDEPTASISLHTGSYPSVAAEQEKIRAELDSRLTRWTGPSENLGGLGEKESGIPGNGWWMEDIGGKGVAEWGGLAFDILFKLRNYKDYK